MRQICLFPFLILLTGCLFQGDTAPVETTKPLPSVEPPAAVSAPAAAEISGRERDTGRTEQPAREVVQPVAPAPVPDYISPLCQAVGNKLGSVSVSDCLQASLNHGALSPANFSLAWRDFSPLQERRPLGRVLVIGGIHGDEFSSVSLMFRWMELLEQYHSGMFHWRFIPLANPDGLLRENSQRQNDSGVDINRNFPTSDWGSDARRYWSEVTYHNPRRNPGAAAASEAETKWLVEQIRDFAPDVIVSIHAPHHLVDYDGPPSAPERLGRLNLSKQGVFPGSLGNYAGHDLGLPVVTVELQSAGIMPSSAEINGMWNDLVRWLRGQLSEQQVVDTD